MRLYAMVLLGCFALPALAQVQFVIPEGTTSIPDYAYYARYDLTNVAIPDSVTNIGICAFKCCTNLTRITVGRGVTGMALESFACMADPNFTLQKPHAVIPNPVSIYFNGKAPTNVDNHAFDALVQMSGGNGYESCNVTVYARPGTAGWINPTNGSSTLAGRPVLYLQIGSGLSGYGAPYGLNLKNGSVQVQVYGNINMTNRSIILESSPDLVNWERLTNIMSDGSLMVRPETLPAFGSFRIPLTNAAFFRLPWPQ